MKPLSPDDVRAGQLVTILRGRDRSWKGDLLTVVAVDRPFVVLRGEGRHASTFHVDLREGYELGEVSPEYAAALKVQP